MKKFLKRIRDEKLIAKIELQDGQLLTGFVTEFDSYNFVIFQTDNVFNPNVTEFESEDGQKGVMVENPETVKEVDFIFSESIYEIDMICSIQMDISHKMPPDALKFYNVMKEHLFKTVKKKPTKKKTAGKSRQTKRDKKPLTSPLSKESDL